MNPLLCLLLCIFSFNNFLSFTAIIEQNLKIPIQACILDNQFIQIYVILKIKCIICLHILQFYYLDQTFIISVSKKMNQNSQSSTNVAPSGKGNYSKIVGITKKKNLKGSFGVSCNQKQSSLFGSNPRFSTHNKSATDNFKNKSIPRNHKFEPLQKGSKFSCSSDKRSFQVSGYQSKIKESLKNSKSSKIDTDTKARILLKNKNKVDKQYTFCKLLSSIDMQSQKSYESSEISFKSPENISSESSSSSSSNSSSSDQSSESLASGSDSIQDSNEQPPVFGLVQERQFSQGNDYQSCHRENFGQSEYDCQQIPTQHSQCWNEYDYHPNGLMEFGHQQQYMPSLMLNYGPVQDFQNQFLIQNYQHFVENYS